MAFYFDCLAEESWLVHLSHPPTGGYPDYRLLVGHHLKFTLAACDLGAQQVSRNYTAVSSSSLCGAILCTFDFSVISDRRALCGVVLP